LLHEEGSLFSCLFSLANAVEDQLFLMWGRHQKFFVVAFIDIDIFRLSFYLALDKVRITEMVHLNKTLNLIFYFNGAARSLSVILILL